MDPHDQPTSRFGVPSSGQDAPPSAAPPLDATAVFGIDPAPAPPPAEPDAWPPATWPSPASWAAPTPAPAPPSAWGPPTMPPAAPPATWGASAAYPATPYPSAPPGASPYPVAPTAAPVVDPYAPSAPPPFGAHAYAPSPWSPPTGTQQPAAPAPWGSQWPPPPPGHGWGGHPVPAPPPRRGGGVVAAVAIVALLCAAALVAGAALVAPGGADQTAVVRGVGPQAQGTDPSAAPSPGPDGRLAPPVAVPAEDPRHAFIETEADGDPAAWDPCEPIEIVVNDRLAPPGAEEILDEAIAQVEAATGLVFVDQGPTDEPPPGVDDRPDRDPARYGEDWSPVLISWTDVAEDPDLEGAAGLASPYPVQAPSGEIVFVTGYVSMAGDYAADLIRLGRRDDVVGVMMHELGHLVGLDHVDDRTQVMTDDPESTPTEWGAGDLYALSQVGRGECEPDI